MEDTRLTFNLSFQSSVHTLATQRSDRESLDKPYTRRGPNLLKNLKEGDGGRDLWTGGRLSLQKGNALAISWAQALTTDNLKEYYDLLKTTPKTHDLMNLPSRIYNMDESGMPLDHKPPKVVAPKGMK